MLIKVIPCPPETIPGTAPTSGPLQVGVITVLIGCAPLCDGVFRVSAA